MGTIRETLSETLTARIAMAWTVLCWLAVSGLTLTGTFRAMDRGVHDLAASMTPPLAERDDIVVVAIDAQSFQSFGERWPWPRDRHAALLDAARESGARAVVFDIVFDAETDLDGALAQAMERFGPVVLASETSVQRTAVGVVETRSLPTERLARSAAAVGDAGLPLDGDGRLRRMPGQGDALAYAAAGALGETGALADGREAFVAFSGEAFPRVISYYQALAPEAYLPPETLKDKVLLIGLALDANPTGRATGDSILMPSHVAGAGPVPGIVAQAHVLASALAPTKQVRAPRWAEVGLTLLAALGTVALIPAALRSMPWMVMLGLLGGCALVGVVLVAGGRGAVILAGPALAGWTLAVLGQAGIVGGTAMAARRRLAAGFSRYVSPALLKQILAQPEPPELGGELRTVTVVVTDLAGFTETMERLDPISGGELLRDYLDTLSAVVLAHGGMIDQFIGDSIVALFNAPIDQENHAERALSCVVAMAAAAETFRAGRDGIGRTRIGAALGQAAVGNFGARQRFHYTAMGDVVNTAARLEAANKQTGTSVLVTEDLHRAAGSPSAFGGAFEVHVPGKRELVRVVSLA
ncbi:MAG: adenylate/guanylate cyclase domain-containing protein [Pseudomonadota bacterium]